MLAEAGCVSSFPDMQELQKKGWAPCQVRKGGFTVFSLKKKWINKENFIIIYIEGDGFAWKNRYSVSKDPTPKNPVSLRLALSDPHPAVIYLSRPCQYIREENALCSPPYWTDRRYSKEVVNALNLVIDELVYRDGAGDISLGLVGFSGGGTMAALLAAKRDDVKWMVTIAANLDHAKWTSLHGVSPLKGSMNPADIADKLQAIPQLHFAGGKDENVPAEIAASYRKNMTEPGCTKIVVLPEFTHHCCWVENWPELKSMAEKMCRKH